MKMLERFFDWVASAKVQRFLSIMFILLGLLFFYIAYSTWEMQQEFIKSEKVQTVAVVAVDEQGGKTLNFSGNSYGVAIDDPHLDGERVKIYYQKNKPYRVSTSKTQYGQGTIEVVGAIFGGCFFPFVVLLINFLIPRAVKRYAIATGNLLED